MISFDVSRDDSKLIHEIANRAFGLYVQHIDPHRINKLELAMSITAAHANGCPLDLDRLVAAEDVDLSHDVFGIMRHIDHETGRLRDCFLPRYAKRSAA